MNNDLISRKWLLENHKSHMGFLGVRKLIQEAPVVDAVEVVRCKDCKYYKKGSCELHSVWPDEYSTGYDCRPDDDDFCSYGERRENNG